jgi:hypothetical protein
MRENEYKLVIKDFKGQITEPSFVRAPNDYSDICFFKYPKGDIEANVILPKWLGELIKAEVEHARKVGYDKAKDDLKGWLGLK